MCYLSSILTFPLYSVRFRKYWDNFYIMTLAMTFTSYLQNLNVHSNKMAEKAMFESIKSGPSLLKKKRFSEKAEQRTVIKFCAGIGKTPTATHKFLKQSEIHKNVSRSIVFKWHKIFRRKRECHGWCAGREDHYFEITEPCKMKFVTLLMVIGY